MELAVEGAGEDRLNDLPGEAVEVLLCFVARCRSIEARAREGAEEGHGLGVPTSAFPVPP